MSSFKNPARLAALLYSFAASLYKVTTMNEDSFRASLAAGGYPEPELIEREANLFNERHTHDFSVKALVLDGQISVITDDGTTTCCAGDEFSLDSGIPHCEQYGPQGARVLVSRITP